MEKEELYAFIQRKTQIIELYLKRDIQIIY